MNIYNWFLNSPSRIEAALSIVCLFLIVGIGSVGAVTSQDTANAPLMYLYTPITSTTQTTGIVIESPQHNGSNWVFSTTTGGVLRISSGTYWEDIYYSSATVSATTNRVTLSGVVRDLCPATLTYVTCGNGRRWGKGAFVELTQDSRLFNLKVNNDRINTTGTGFALRGTSTTYPMIRLNSVTTAQRIAMSAANGDLVYDTSTGAIMQYVGGAWGTVGTTTLVNASESAAGKGQLASTGAMVNHRLTGSTGAAEVLYSAYVTGTGGTTNRWKIPLLGRLGTLSGSLLGQSCPGGTGTYLNGLGRCTTLSAADMVNAPAGSGTNLAFTNIYGSIITNTAGGIFTDIDASLNGTVTASVGDTIVATLRMSVGNDASGGDGYFDIRVGGGRIGRLDNPSMAGSGGLLQVHLSAADTALTDRPVSITVFHRVQTGATLTIAPQWKSISLAGGSSFLRSNGKPPIYFQVMIIKNI